MTETTQTTLEGWELRTEHDNVWINPHGSYGLPVAHRIGCRWTPAPELAVMAQASMGVDPAEVLWRYEQSRIDEGLPRSLEFCQRCLIRRASLRVIDVADLP